MGLENHTLVTCCRVNPSRLQMSLSGVIHVLTGCTAVGKTETALQWAEAHGAEIISCDSLLFYRGMDIGTAKPTKDELSRVPHHLIDICEPSEPMDIARYVALARIAVQELVTRGVPILVTGGSGFYLKSFFGPVVDAVTVSSAVRQHVAEMSQATALAELHQRNPAGLGALDVSNPRRVTRALERCIASGRTLAELQAEFAAQPGAFADCEIRLVELVRQADELDQRIRSRVEQMIAGGLVEEVRGLLAAGLMKNPSGAGAIGYREVRAHLDGSLPLENLAGEIISNTRALVKKQRTWFRTQLPAHRQLPAEDCVPEKLFAG